MMTCPNCKKTIDEGSYCTHCKVDAILYTATERMSQALYNKGLASAQVSDLSGAIDHLTRSVDVNKKNVEARNLLGLVQFEAGRVGDALGNWVISANIQKENNNALRYMAILEKNRRGLDKLNDIVNLYNQAVVDIKEKRSDIAIIALKKALEGNPKFIDAMNLLSCCYLLEREREKARVLIERVLEIDANNTTALSYYYDLYPDKGRPMTAMLKNLKGGVSPAALPVASSFKKINLQEPKQRNFHLTEILFAVAGAACMAVIMYVLIFPTMSQNHTMQVGNIQSQLVEVEEANDTLRAEHEATLSLLNDAERQLQQMVHYREEQESIQERNAQVMRAYDLFNQGSLRDAVNTLEQVELAGLPLDMQERAERIVALSYPVLRRLIFDEGVAAYAARDFAKARVDFLQAYRFVEDDYFLTGEILYHLGWIYSLDTDVFLDANNDTSAAYFERLLDEFPTHGRVNAARNRLNVVQSR